MQNAAADWTLGCYQRREGHLERCMRVEACSESARCPHVRKQPLQGFGLWQPLPHPSHRRRIAVPSGLFVGLHRERDCTPVKSLDCGWRQWFACRLQDGEGWTPRNVHQSILMLGTICYRLLASEQYAPSAIQRACVEYAGKEALKGLLGWQASAKPLLIA